MIRLARVVWLLLLLFVLGRQRWGVVAEELSVAPHTLAHTGPHFVAHTGEHDSVQSEKLVHDDYTGIKSRLADFPCPDAAAIAPCVCTSDVDYNIDLDCTYVESEEQLERIFRETFPVKELHGFYMTGNHAITVLRNISNGVSFEIINLSPGPLALQSISEEFILDSRLSLKSVEIYESKLLSDGFPFAILADMETLFELDIRFCNFTWIPKLNSTTIQKLKLASASIDAIEPGTFDDVTHLNHLTLFDNSLTELRGRTVPVRETAMYFYGHTNSIEVIQPGAFFFVDAASAASNENLSIYLNSNKLQSLQASTFPLRNSPVMIYLHKNQIVSIEPETFVLPEATDSFNLTISLDKNQLTTFDEAVFGDLMPFIGELYLYDNPLSCGCDIAWVVASSAFMAKIDPGATCANGTNLHDLDPQYFVDSC